MIWVIRCVFLLLLCARAQGWLKPPAKPYICRSSGFHGRVVPGAKVQVRLDGHETAAAATNENGEAAFAALPPASYEITASKDGFETAR